MGDIAAVAERLRLVRQARRKFLRLWEIDRALVDPMLERLAADLGGPTPAQPAAGAGPGPDSDAPPDDPAHPRAPRVDQP